MEMPKEEKDEVQIINEGTIPEQLKHCPECKEKDIISSVERLQYEEDRYWVFCTRRDKCSFLEEFKGKVVITKEDLIIHGLPGQLAEHMDVFYEDINKIVRLCMSEYIKMRCLEAPMVDFDLKGVEESVRTLAEAHSLDDFTQLNESTMTIECNKDVVRPAADPYNLQGVGQSTQPAKIHECDLPGENELARTLAGFQDVDGLSQPFLPTKTNECDLTIEEKLVQTLATFQDLDGLSQPPLPTKSNESDLFGNEDLVDLCGNLDCFIEHLPPTNTNDKLTLVKNQENKFVHGLNNSKTCHQTPKCYKLCDSLRKLAESLVADLPFHYREKIKIAFSKIKGYNFPKDFPNINSPDKLPLLKIVEKREKEERIKAEMDEHLMGFMDEMYGIKELFE